MIADETKDDSDEETQDLVSYYSSHGRKLEKSRLKKKYNRQSHTQCFYNNKEHKYVTSFVTPYY